uniref:FISUMP domain-containing protein n=1 Tax=Pedobacter schmidteae TaxID=2201271 RepID=UPI000EB2570A|nr:FISUMP domain-containing protein [Pedobacter schmidteae]
MKFLFNVLAIGLLLQFSSCVKEEIDTPLLSPELSDFTISPKRMGEEPFILVNPKSKSDGVFVFKVNDSRLASINGKVVTLKQNGTCTITAIQLASGGFKKDSIQATFVINPLQAPLMSEFKLATKMLGEAPFELVAPKSNSKGAITYTSSNPDVASITGSTVTIKSTGKTTITANQAADGTYLAGKITSELIIINPPVQEQTVTDVDGNVYKTIKIGTQTWMMENLKTTRYRDGTPIPNLTDPAAWSADLAGAYCNYDNNPANANTYGRLYNWDATHNIHQLAPTGWHVPTEAEWAILYAYIGGTRESGLRIQDTRQGYWANQVVANNETKFSGLPGGIRTDAGLYAKLSWDGIWWTDTRLGTVTAVAYDLYAKGYIERLEAKRASGFSVRCIKD